MAAADYRLMTEETGQRIAIALENLAGFGNYLTTGDVVNNMTSGGTTVPLSAEMGKALNDAHPVKSGTYAVANNASFNVNISTGALVCSVKNDYGASVMGDICVYGILGGNLRENNITGGSTFSASYSNGTLTITNTAGMYQMFMIFYV